MRPVYVWLALAVIFLLLEIASPAFLFICFTVGALVAALASLVTDSYLVQALVFAVVSIVAIPISRPLANRLSRTKSGRHANVDALIGREAYVIEPIDPASNTGIVRIGSEKWRAVAAQKIPSGQMVVVTRIDGATLSVQPKE